MTNTTTIAASPPALAEALRLIQLEKIVVIPLWPLRAGICTCKDGAECGNPGKHPWLKWAPDPKSGFDPRVKYRNPNEIKHWFRQNPHSGVGILAGASGLFVLDVDPRHGGDISLERLLEEHGPLPETVLSMTGSGGRHYLFKHPGNSYIKSEADAFGPDYPGLDTRADGGLIAVEPTLHKGGLRYAWECDHALGEFPLADAPQWMIEKLTGTSTKRGKQIQELPEIVKTGTRNETLFTIGCALRAKNFSKEEIQPALGAANRRRCNPPLSELEVEKIVDSVCSYSAGSSNGNDQPRPDDGQRAVVARLSVLPPVEYDKVRKEEAKKLGCRLATLDAAVQAARPKPAAAPGERGQAVTWDDPEPCSEPVDGAELLNDLSDVFSRYLALPKSGADIFALWVLHTYTFDYGQITPILAVTSPIMRCGKSKALAIVQAVSRHPLSGANISTSAVFRSIEAWRPTLVIDEADSFLRENEELRGVLNSGHSRELAFVIRVESINDKLTPARFSTWAPKAIALIGKLPATLADRAIEVKMRRRTPSEKIERWRGGAALVSIRRRCMAWAADNAERIGAAEPAIPDGLDDRQGDNWTPLFVLADLAGGTWPERARVACGTAVQRDADDGIATLLLSDIRDVFDQADKISTTEILESLIKLDEHPWPTFAKGRAITARNLAHLLKPFGINSRTIRIGTVTAKGYEIADFDDAFSRYLPKTGFLSVTSVTTLKQLDLDDNLSVTSNENVTAKKRCNPNEINNVTDVTDKIPPKGGAREQGIDLPY